MTVQDAFIKFILDESTADDLNELINSDDFIADDETMAKIRERMAELKAEQANGKKITWYGKRGQVETVTENE